MFSLSKESENSLKQGILKLVSEFLKIQSKPEPRLLGLITSQQLEKELDIKHITLLRWEKLGLKRYQPPVEDTRKIYYKISDVLIFMGVENE